MKKIFVILLMLLLVSGCGATSDRHTIEPANGPYVIGSPETDRNLVSEITFYTETKNAPDNAVDVSEKKDGSVLFWMEETAEGLHIFYAADGGVTANPDSSSFFSGYENVQEICFNDAFHTDGVTDMSQMFFGCDSLETLDLSTFNTENVTDMSGMFSRCSNLKTLDLSNFSTEKVRDMSYMFTRCVSLEDLNLENFQTRNVTTMEMMFSYCKALKQVIAQDFTTDGVENTASMYLGCEDSITLIAP